MVSKKEIENFSSEIQKKFSEFLFKEKKIGDLTNEEPKLLKTGITTLDIILGGGIIIGGFVQLVGRAGCGKTSLAIKILSNLQKEHRGKCLCLFIDSECTATRARLAQLGVKDPEIDPVFDITLEDIVEIIDSTIEFKKKNKELEDYPVIVVWDSIASTLSKKEMAAEDLKEVVGYKARLLSVYLPKIAPLLLKYSITIVAINQLRDNLSLGVMPSAPAIKGLKNSENIPGGRALQFSTSQLIFMHDTSNLEESSFGFDGKEVECYCIKNKVFTPMIKTKMALSYAGGFSDFWSSFLVLRDEKYILTNGPWYSMKGYEKKFQLSKISGIYQNDPEFRKAFNMCLEEYKNDLYKRYAVQKEEMLDMIGEEENIEEKRTEKKEENVLEKA